MVIVVILIVAPKVNLLLDFLFEEKIKGT
ncbi:MAG: hypothetical protein ACKE5M_07235 [Methylophilaceae bacterium]